MYKELSLRTARRLRSGAEDIPQLAATVGLDAFVDEIVRVVDKRTSQAEFTRIEQISELGSRIVNAAGRSTNLELVVERVKLGGNGPIMANALAALGPAVTCIGPLGHPEVHPAFQEIAGRATVVSLGQPAHTDALEFADGKLMMGKMESLNDVNWERIQERMNPQEIQRLFVQPSLVALVNWTMIPAMSAIWEKIAELLAAASGSDGLYFFDLADPEKHPEETIAAACRLLAGFNSFRTTLFGLNEKEAILVAHAFGYEGGHTTREDIGAIAVYISKALPVSSVVVHPRAYAVTASGGALTADVDGPFTDNPLISTGAGDHFNAGFCLAKLLHLDDEEAATAAVATSGYYVRHAASPSLQDLARFLEEQGAD